MKEVPAIREDDAPVVSLGNWRLDQKSQGKENSGEKRKVTNLAGKLLWHFRELFWLQTVSIVYLLNPLR